MSRTLLFGAALVAVLGCGRPARVHRPGEEWLETIRIEGNRAIEDDDLVPGLALERTRHAGRSLDPYQLSVDTQRIRAAYLRRGFFDVDAKARVEHQGAAQIVVFTIVEGKRATTQVVLQGLPADVPLARARALIALEDGAPFDYEAYDAAKEPLLLLLNDAGYAHAQLDAAVLADRATGVATARFAIEAGPRSTFGPITIVGVDGQLAQAIMGRLTFAEGDSYSKTALQQSYDAIVALERFATARVEPEIGDGTIVPVKIAVVLGTRHEFRLGGGVAYEPLTFEARGRIGGSYINAAHPLWTFAGDYRPALTWDHSGSNLQQKHRFLATAYRQDMFRPRLRGEIELGADYLTTEAYTSYGPHGRLGVSTPLGVPWLLGHAGWVIEYLAFREPKVFDPTLQELRLDQPQRRGAFEQSIVADLRDNQLDTHLGLYAELRATEGTRLPWGDLRYLQLTPEVRGYVPLGKQLVLAARVRAGAIFGDVPVTERYFSGGAASQRGFSERRLSPGVPGTVNGEPGTVVIGGAGLLETSVEVRIPLGKLPVGIQIFLDGADVTLTPEDLDPGHLHWAAGAGVWLSVGPVKVRVDIGYRLNRTGPTDPEYETGTLKNFHGHIGVGDTF